MSMLTRCYNPKKSPAVWHGGGFAKVLILSLFVLLFAAGRLRLQFAVDDMQRQTAIHQDRQIDLRSKIAQVQSDVEVEKRGDPMLLLGATKMQMVRADSDSDGRVVVTRADIRRFNAPGEAAVAKAAPVESAWKISMAGIASSVGIVSQAVAAEVDGRE